MSEDVNFGMVLQKAVLAVPTQEEHAAAVAHLRQQKPDDVSDSRILALKDQIAEMRSIDAGRIVVTVEYARQLSAANQARRDAEARVTELERDNDILRRILATKAAGQQKPVATGAVPAPVPDLGRQAASQSGMAELNVQMSTFFHRAPERWPIQQAVGPSFPSLSQISGDGIPR